MPPPLHHVASHEELPRSLGQAGATIPELRVERVGNEAPGRSRVPVAESSSFPTKEGPRSPCEKGFGALAFGAKTRGQRPHLAVDAVPPVEGALDAS